MIDLVNNIIFSAVQKILNYLPSFFGGLVVLLVGLVISLVLKKVINTVFSFLQIEQLLQKTRLVKKNEVTLWEQAISELLRWTVVILFLIPTLEIWGLPQATTVLNQFLFYLPNVIVSVVIAFVGLVASNLGSDLVRHSIKTLGSTSANAVAVFTKWMVVFFTVLIVLNQLGVAQDLIRILFTGIVAMLTLAGGLAFGLGGKDIARDVLEEWRAKLK